MLKEPLWAFFMKTTMLCRSTPTSVQQINQTYLAYRGLLERVRYMVPVLENLSELHPVHHLADHPSLLEPRLEAGGRAC